MAIEGLVAIMAGIAAGSIALIAFGIDSAIEGFASVVIVWRFTGSRTLSHQAEVRAQKLVAVQFFILAPYVGIEAIRALINGSHPEESLVGIALAASSVVVMPWLGRAKQRIGSRLDSSATASEGKQNLLCASWLLRCSSDCSATHSSDRGGSIPSLPYSSPLSRCRKAGRLGGATPAAASNARRKRVAQSLG
jgi:hypothetical protein